MEFGAEVGTEMPDLKEMTARMLKLHEGVRLKPYTDSVGKMTIGSVDVCPSLPIHNRPDARLGHAIFWREHLRGNNAPFIGRSNLADLVVRQFGGISTRLALRSFLQSRRVGVSHLFAHRCNFEIAYAIVAFVAVLVINSQTFRNRTNKVRVDKSMHEAPVGLSALVRQPDTQVAVFRRVLAKKPIRLAPETRNTTNETFITDFIETFVSDDWYPHV